MALKELNRPLSPSFFGGATVGKEAPDDVERVGRAEDDASGTEGVTFMFSLPFSTETTF